jgi:hypothetical protein
MLLDSSELKPLAKSAGELHLPWLDADRSTKGHDVAVCG